jgi:hypothetical protein
MFTRIAMLLLLAPLAGLGLLSSQPLVADADFVVPFCIEVMEAHHEGMTNSASRDSPQRGSREFGLSSADWQQVVSVCSSTLRKIGELASEARMQERNANGRLGAPAVALIQKRRLDLVSEGVVSMESRLSPGGKTTVRRHFTDLVANSSKIRIEGAQ